MSIKKLRNIFHATRLTDNIHAPPDILGNALEEMRVMENALLDIAMVNIPNVPRGVTVGMEQYGPFARKRAEDALTAAGVWEGSSGDNN